MSAREKLEEAEFFLSELLKAKNRRQERFLLSAFVSAWRSVTFALQDDYRKAFGVRFDSWYEEKAKELRALPMAKEMLLIRNQMIHEGNSSPFVAFSADLENGGQIDVVWDQTKHEDGLVSFTVRPPRGALSYSLEEIGSLSGEQEVRRVVDDFSKNLPEWLRNATVTQRGLKATPDSDTFTHESLIASSQISLAALRLVVDEAVKEFGKPGAVHFS